MADLAGGAVRVVVLGAGYAGLVAAQLVARHPGTEVRLVNERDWFVERVRLHQLAAGQPLRRRGLRELLGGSPVRFVLGRAVALYPEAHGVELAGGRHLGYDVLLYAPGSRTDASGVPGAAEHAYPLATWEDAEELRARLTGGGAVAVVGGGLTGIEAAAELAEARPDLTVRLVTAGALGGELSARGRAHLRRSFDRLGVEVRDGARVAEVRADGVRLADGGHVAADTVVWTAGFRVPELARAAGLAVDPAGRVRVDGALRSVSHPDVYAVGDAAAMWAEGGGELRMACATGLPAARHAARSIGDRLAGRTPGTLRFRYLNQCVSLGRRDALIQFVRADDSPVERVLTGRLAARYKEAIVRGAALAQRHPALVRLTPGGGRGPDVGGRPRNPSARGSA